MRKLDTKYFDLFKIDSMFFIYTRLINMTDQNTEN